MTTERREGGRGGERGGERVCVAVGGGGGGVTHVAGVVLRLGSRQLPRVLFPLQPLVRDRAHELLLSWQQVLLFSLSKWQKNQSAERVCQSLSLSLSLSRARVCACVWTLLESRGVATGGGIGATSASHDAEWRPRHYLLFAQPFCAKPRPVDGSSSSERRRTRRGRRSEPASQSVSRCSIHPGWEGRGGSGSSHTLSIFLSHTHAHAHARTHAHELKMEEGRESHFRAGPALAAVFLEKSALTYFSRSPPLSSGCESLAVARRCDSSSPSNSPLDTPSSARALSSAVCRTLISAPDFRPFTIPARPALPSYSRLRLRLCLRSLTLPLAPDLGHARATFPPLEAIFPSTNKRSHTRARARAFANSNGILQTSKEKSTI